MELRTKMLWSRRKGLESYEQYVYIIQLKIKFTSSQRLVEIFFRGIYLHFSVVMRTSKMRHRHRHCYTPAKSMVAVSINKFLMTKIRLMGSRPCVEERHEIIRSLCVNN